MDSIRVANSDDMVRAAAKLAQFCPHSEDLVHRSLA